MKEFWEKANSASPKPNSEKRELNAGDSEKDAGCEEMGALYEASILGQSQLDQSFQETSRTAQEQLTNSSKEFVSCISDTLTENSQVEETAMPSAASNAPLGVASPQFVESVSENEEELPTAMDCTTLTLVDDAQSNLALLLAENQDCGVEQRDCHEGTGSAAPVAENEFSDKEVIADQTPMLVEQGQSASLPGENQVSGVEVKTVDDSYLAPGNSNVNSMTKC